jgi:hypothetical protein
MFKTPKNNFLIHSITTFNLVFQNLLSQNKVKEKRNQHFLNGKCYIITILYCVIKMWKNNMIKGDAKGIRSYAPHQPRLVTTTSSTNYCIEQPNFCKIPHLNLHMTNSSRKENTNHIVSLFHTSQLFTTNAQISDLSSLVRFPPTKSKIRVL